MKASKKTKTAINIRFNSKEYKMFFEVICKVIDGEAPVHNIGILNDEQRKFLTNLQKILDNGTTTNTKKDR